MSMVIPDARASADATNANIGGDTSVVLIKSAVDAISTAVGNKTNTATITISGKSGSDIMVVLQQLKQKGYKVTNNSGSTLSVSW